MKISMHGEIFSSDCCLGYGSLIGGYQISKEHATSIFRVEFPKIW
jgi:hypothetical protein